MATPNQSTFALDELIGVADEEPMVTYTATVDGAVIDKLEATAGDLLQLMVEPDIGDADDGLVTVRVVAVATVDPG